MSRRAVRVGLLGLAASALILFAPAVLADGSGAGLAGSPHDFTNDTSVFGGTPGDAELCYYCHAPHDGGLDEGLIGLLWNHQLSTATYTMYSSASLEGAQDTQPTGISKMCFGCHDGTVSLDAFDDNAAAAGGTIFIQDEFGTRKRIPGLTDNGNLDLRATHPISIVYDEAADSGLHPTTNAMGSSGTIDDVLEAGKVQCHSCHDVHDGVGESVAGTALLREAQTTNQGGVASGLCLTCHIK